jgi:hypothetical protein
MVKCLKLSEHVDRTDSSFYCPFNNNGVVLHFDVHNGFHEEKKDIMGGSTRLL